METRLLWQYLKLIFTVKLQQTSQTINWFCVLGDYLNIYLQIEAFNNKETCFLSLFHHKNEDCVNSLGHYLKHNERIHTTGKVMIYACNYFKQRALQFVFRLFSQSRLGSENVTQMKMSYKSCKQTAPTKTKPDLRLCRGSISVLTVTNTPSLCYDLVPLLSLCKMEVYI